MSVNLAPGPFGAGYQAFDTVGKPLNGGLLNTYLAGSTTPQPTFTTSTGNVQNANPIVMGTDGRPQSGGNIVEIWLTAGLAYKFVLTDSLGTLIASYDNLVGINDIAASSSTSEWLATGLTPTFISTTSFSFVGNQTATFPIGIRTKTVNTGGTIYSNVITASYSAGPNTTTITVTNDSGVIDSGLSSVSYGILRSDNESLPPFNTLLPVLADSTDPTKRVKFNVASVSTGTVRTVSFTDKSGVNALISDLTGIIGASRNLRMTVTPAGNTVTCTADLIVTGASLSTTQSLLTSCTLALNLASTGQGGMDTGLPPVNSFVALYAANTTTGTQTIFACNINSSSATCYAGTNTPAGVIGTALIGVWPTNASSQLVPGYIQAPAERKFSYSVVKQILTGNAAVTPTAVQSITAGVPTIARAASFLLGSAQAGSNAGLFVAADIAGTGGRDFNAAAGAAGTTFTGVPALTIRMVAMDVPILTSQSVFINLNTSGSNAQMNVIDYSW